jgi:hypothetical protein
MKSKRAMEIEVLVWWIIAIVVLAIIVAASIILKNKGFNALDYIGNLLRFRGK